MGLDINLNTSKIDIGDDGADDIIIEITGLKSISKFIGLEDTPLYYDNGKFFKVEDNKIVYADIQWKDISGDISESPEIVAVISDLVNEVASDIIDERINLHNLNEEAHPYIQNIIKQNYDTLDAKIDNTKEELSETLNTEIINRETADNKLSENMQQETLARIEADTTLQNNINSVASDLSDEISARESADTTLSNSISDLSDGLIQEITDRQTADTGLQSQITSNYNTLDSKIDSVESSLNDLSDTVDTNDTAINNKVDNINNTLTNSISTLSDTVSNNYTTLDNKIDSVEGALADSVTALDNKYDNITSGLDDKIDDVDDTLTTHISDNSNPHNVTKTQIGLSNVDNTSDLNKPISTATQTALDGKVPNTRTVNNKPLSSDIVLDYSDVNALPDTTTINDLTTTAQQNALNSGINSTLTQQITTNQNNISNLSSTVSSNYTTLDNRITSEVNTLNGSISDEETARINADNGLQSQIDAMTSASDVTDIVGTYAELQAYDTTSLPDKSIIKVLQDESRNNETTYYRWVITNGTGAWVLIGEEGPYYTKSEADGRFVNQATTVNNKALSSNITLTASDVGALPDSTVIGDGTLTIQKNGTTIDTFTANTTSNKTINITVPTDTQDLTNGAGYITNSALNGYATENWVNNQGYLTSVPTATTSNLGLVKPDGTTITIDSNGVLSGSASVDVDQVYDGTSANAQSGVAIEGELSANYQAKLVSGSNIKTINNTSLLGNGNIDIQGGSTITIDEALSTTSTNPAQNKVITNALNLKANTADLSIVATSGSYNDLSNKPTIPESQVNSDWNATSGVAQILNKPNLSTVAISGSYNDLINKPTIPSVGNAEIEIQKNGIKVDSFTTNQSGDKKIINISGLQTEITSTNKLSADLVADGTINKVVTANEKTIWNNKQNALVSGTNIKTINSTSLLGSGDISVQPTITSSAMLSSDLVDDTNHTHKFATAEQLTRIATNTTNISTINSKIPAEATSSNKLADKAFVNSTVQTATANFRGNWDTWTTVPTSASSYPVDYVGSTTPTVNDYMVVQNASDYTGETLEGTWRFKYSGTWATDGKNGWLPEYQVNETPLTAAQLVALNSGITSSDVTLIGTALQPTDLKTINGNSLVGSGNIIIDSLPSQTGHNGKFLTTDGTDASWATVTIPTPTYDSVNERITW